MKVFEFLFNPQGREDLIFESFSFQPKEVFEKKLGHLFVVGMLKNALPQDLNFLKEVSQEIKNNFYKINFSKTKIALKESLKKTNKFLEEKVKSGKVNWLGNFSCAVLAIKDFSIYFTKTGQIKIILLRGKRILDITKKLKLEETEPYPLKFFGTILTSNLSPGDFILILTKEVFEFFQSENIFEELKKCPLLEEKKLIEILEKKQKEMTGLYGIALGILLAKTEKEYLAKTFSLNEKKEFSFKEVFEPISSFFKNFFEKQTLSLIERIRISQPPVSLESVKRRKRNNFLILILFVLLLVGFFFVKNVERKRYLGYEKTLNEIEQKITSLKDESELNKYLKSALQDVSQLLNSPVPKTIKNRSLSLKETITQKLEKINKIQKIETPKIFLDLSNRNLTPEKIFFFNDNVLILDSQKNLFRVNEKKDLEEIKTAQKINLISNFKNEGLLIFSLPNSISILKDEKIEISEIQPPYFPFSFDEMETFENNVYFLDKKEGEIIQYAKKESGWSNPKSWLKSEKPKGAKSFSIDGGIWVLTNNNEIWQYYRGELKQKIKLDIFPEVKDLLKIIVKPNFSFLYLLAPDRVIVLDKKGSLVSQFYFDEFKNLKDFAISENEKMFYLLRDNFIYQIENNLK